MDLGSIRNHRNQPTNLHPSLQPNPVPVHQLRPFNQTSSISSDRHLVNYPAWLFNRSGGHELWTLHAICNSKGRRHPTAVAAAVDPRTSCFHRQTSVAHHRGCDAASGQGNGRVSLVLNSSGPWTCHHGIHHYSSSSRSIQWADKMGMRGDSQYGGRVGSVRSRPRRHAILLARGPGKLSSCPTRPTTF